MMVSDFVQIGVVTKNEMIKCVRGKKFLISLAIVGIVFILITLLQFAMGTWDSMKDNMGLFVDVYFSNLPLVIALVVALLSSVAIVSEFEERTALILFTRPIRRTTILVGKIISCLVIEAAIILGYYILASIVGFIQVGSLSGSIVESYFIAVLYAFAASGIAFIISSFFKKGSVCTIIAMLVLVLVLPITTSMIGSGGSEGWYMMDDAGSSMYKCVPEYVEYYNEMSNSFADVVKSASAILKGYTSGNLDEAIVWINDYVTTAEFQALDPDTQASIYYLQAYLNMSSDPNLVYMIQVLDAMTESSMLAPMKNPDVTRSVIVLIIWGLAGFLVSWFRFVRREF